MVEELFNKTFGKVFTAAEYEHIEDSPGESTDIRVTLPFYDLEREEKIVVMASYDEEKHLFQISDLGFCCSRLDEVSKDAVRLNKNFIRANGFNFNYSAENNYFFVLSPVVDFEDENVNVAALIGHYMSVILSYNQ